MPCVIIPANGEVKRNASASLAPGHGPFVYNHPDTTRKRRTQRMFNWLKRKEEPKSEEHIQEQQQKVEEGLTRTRRGFFKQIASLFEVDEITEDIWEELETLLIQADVGVDTTVVVLDRLRERVRVDRLKKPDDVYEALQEELVAVLVKPERDLAQKNKAAVPEAEVEAGPYVILVVGVNGVGKTTTIAKLAKYYRDQDKSVII